MSYLNVILDGNPEFYYFFFPSDSTVGDLINQVKSTFALNQELIASVYGGILNPEFPLNLYTVQDDFILLQKEDKTKIEIPLPILKPVNIQSGMFQIYTSLSFESMTVGNPFNINRSHNVEQIKSQLKPFVKSLLPSNQYFDFLIYIPGGALFESGTLNEFFTFFKNSPPKLYLVVYTQQPPQGFDSNYLPERVWSCKTKSEEFVISPMCKSSERALSNVASFLAFLNQVGNGSIQFLSTVVRLIPFAPLVCQLFNLINRSQLYYHQILSITAPLYTFFKYILSDIYSGENVLLLTNPVATFLAFLSPEFYDFKMKNFPFTTFRPPFLSIGNSAYFNHIDSKQKVVVMKNPDFKKTFEIIFKILPPGNITNESDSDVKNSFRRNQPLDIQYFNDKCFIDFGNRICLILEKVQGSADEYIYFDPIEDKTQRKSPEELGNLKQPTKIIPSPDKPIQSPDPVISKNDPSNPFPPVDINQFPPLPFIGGTQPSSTDPIPQTNNVPQGIHMTPTLCKQLVFILCDISGSMVTEVIENFTRYDVTRFFFFALTDKIFALNKTMKTGLIFFDYETILKSELNDIKNEFQKHLYDNPMRRGMTAIFQSINTAIEKLISEKVQFKKAQARILLLTDGSDNIGKADPYDLLTKLCSNQILLDTFLISNEFDPNLIALTKLAGGSVFYNEDPSKTASVFLQDELLNLDRRNYQIPLIPPSKDEFNSAVRNPQRHLNQGLVLKDLPTASGQYASNRYVLSSAGVTSTIILRELHLIFSQVQDPPNIRVYPNEKYFNTLWKVAILGPDNSPYANCWWGLSVSFPINYPFSPPSILFIRPPYHLNISDQGNICLDMLDQNYNQYLRVYELLLEILRLLENPNDLITIDFERGHNPYDSQKKKRIADPTKVNQYNRQNSKGSYKDWEKEWHIKHCPKDRKSQIAISKEKYIPLDLRCPLSHQRYQDPVRALDGKVYDRNNLAQWLRNTDEDEIQRRGLAGMNPSNSENWERDQLTWNRLQELGPDE